MEGFVQFTLCILDKFQRANASDFQLVSNVYSVNSPKKDKDKKDTEIATNVGTVGAAISMLGIMTARRDIESWQKLLFNMEEKLEDLEEGNDASERIILRVTRRISDLEENIGEAKKKIPIKIELNIYFIICCCQTHRIRPICYSQ